MKLSLLVINEANSKSVIVERYDYTEVRLVPRIARRAAVVTQMTPCWVTDGNRVYRVTRAFINLRDFDDLRHWLVRKIQQWQTNGTKVPDYFLQI